MLELVHAPVAPGVRDPGELAVPVVLALQQRAPVRLTSLELDLLQWVCDWA